MILKSMSNKYYVIQAIYIIIFDTCVQFSRPADSDSTLSNNLPQEHAQGDHTGAFVKSCCALGNEV